jgi:hypothetical protein
MKLFLAVCCAAERPEEIKDVTTESGDNDD